MNKTNKVNPDENLREQRSLQAELARKSATREDGTVDYEYACQMARLTDLAKSLDEWLSSGGSLPSDWKKPPNSKVDSHLRVVD